MLFRLFIFLILVVSSIQLTAQQIHIRYFHVRSPIATLYEDLYINKDNQVISIQDSIININTNNGDISVITNNRKATKRYYISDISKDSDRNFFYTSNVDNDDFFIHDKVPAPQWKIDKTSTKKIAGYECYKATTNFRGSNITAYYAKDLPYSVGPFKFFGLPGLILDVRADNRAFDIWKAEKVEVNNTTQINFKPNFLKKERITQKEYIKIKEKNSLKIQQKINESMSSDSFKNIKTTFTNRVGLEQKYEWEE